METHPQLEYLKKHVLQLMLAIRLTTDMETRLYRRRIELLKLKHSTIKAIFDSRIICRMMCKSMSSTNAEIAPVHYCLGEPDCLASIMLLFQTDWGTQHVGTAVVSVSILAVLQVCISMHKNQLCLFLISTSSHDELVVFTAFRAFSPLCVKHERPLIITYSLYSENILHYHFHLKHVSVNSKPDHLPGQFF